MTTNYDALHIGGHSFPFAFIRAETEGTSSVSDCLVRLGVAPKILISPLTHKRMHEDLRFPLPNASIAPTIRPAILGV